MSLPIATRLDVRRGELMSRLKMIEAADELDDAGGEIVLEAIRSELEFLCGLYQLLLLTRSESSCPK